MVTVAQAMTEVLGDPLVTVNIESFEDYYEVCAAEVDKKILAKVLALRKGLKRMVRKLRDRSKLNSKASLTGRYGRVCIGDS